MRDKEVWVMKCPQCGGLVFKQYAWEDWFCECGWTNKERDDE